MAYTVSVSSPMSKRERISPSLGIYCGTVNISVYSVGSPITITAITRYFTTSPNASASIGGTFGILAVTPTGPSSNGYMLQWSYGAGCFVCYRPTYIPIDSNVAAGVALLASGTSAFHATSAIGLLSGASIEASAGDVIGTCGFIAIGFCHA